MFLKKDTLNYGDASVELHELSGLQRVEYLEYIQQRTAQYDEETADAGE
ncbi:phage minor tail protein G, partial [Salmonella enterica subsp. enterica]|nr:phage minor tail protein G [Salmonella enterica subsp. enterica]EDV0529397.1 phage minor tail protein G [Salmonella enterica subsp. enterica]